jgi:hypothetical protein
MLYIRTISHISQYIRTISHISLYIRTIWHISLYSQETSQLHLYVIFKKVSSSIFRTVTVGAARLSAYVLTSQHGRVGKYSLTTTVDYRDYKVLHIKFQIVDNFVLIQNTENKNELYVLQNKVSCQ